jgi:hypothetical protein
MAEDTFMIGLANNIYDLLPVSDLFSPAGEVFDPDWSFQDFAGSVDLNDGTTQGQGFPLAKWRWNHISEENRAVLRGFCPGLSARVFIHTRTNELDIYGVAVWETFAAVMKWTDTDEDKAADETLGMILTFTHLELQA